MLNVCFGLTRESKPSGYPCVTAVRLVAGSGVTKFGGNVLAVQWHVGTHIPCHLYLGGVCQIKTLVCWRWRIACGRGELS